MVSITLIAAVALNGVIGRDGGMPWRLPSDLKRFKAATLGKPLIMGRKTLEAIGKPLPGRDNIIVTRQQNLAHDGVFVAASLEKALDHAKQLAAALHVDEIMIAGGGEIYRQSMARADKLLITRVLAEPDGDAHFPDIDETVWKLVEETGIETGPRDSAGLKRQIYQRR